MWSTSLVLLACLVVPVPAPVPRCSPWIIINKLVEWTSLWSDSNSYFPIGPCEYGGPLQALMAGDANAVFLLDEPEKIPRHNIYELVWFLKTGMTRMKRMMLGLEPFVYDFGILTEGYQHYTPRVRTTQLGHGTKRRPEFIDNEELWKKFVKSRFNSFLTEGPDKQQTKYTPQGPLRLRKAGQKKRRLGAPPPLEARRHLARGGGGPGASQAESQEVKQFVKAESEGRRPLRRARARAGSERWSQRDTVSQDWTPVLRSASGEGFQPIQGRAQSTSDPSHL